MAPPGSTANELSVLLSGPRVLEIHRRDWGLATVLAALRTSSNEQPGQHRRPGQDRGGAQNLLGDLQGALAELLLLQELSESLTNDASLRHCLYDPDGGGSAHVSSSVDAEIEIPEGTVEIVQHRTRAPAGRTVERPAVNLRLEAKCHLDLPPHVARDLGVSVKRDFAVNHQAVVSSHRLGAIGFVPFVTVIGGRHAIRGRMVLLADALRWPVAQYKAGNDPALAMPLKRRPGRLHGPLARRSTSYARHALRRDDLPRDREDRQGDRATTEGPTPRGHHGRATLSARADANRSRRRRTPCTDRRAKDACASCRIEATCRHLAQAAPRIDAWPTV